MKTNRIKPGHAGWILVTVCLISSACRPNLPLPPSATATEAVQPTFTLIPPTASPIPPSPSPIPPTATRAPSPTPIPGLQILYRKANPADLKWTLYLYNQDTQESLPLISGLENTGCQSLSPDGKRMIFSNRVSGNTVFQIDFTSDIIRPLDALCQADMLAWRPTGEVIVFYNPNKQQFELYDLAQEKALASFGKTASEFRFSNDGRRLAFFQDHDLVAAEVRFNASGQVIGVEEPVKVITLPAGVSPYQDLTWSPTGDRLAFRAQGGGYPNTPLYVVNLDGSQLRRLTDSTSLQPGALMSLDWEEKWSPDGQKLIFQAAKMVKHEGEAYYDSGEPQLYLVEVTGGSPIQLTGQDSEAPFGSSVAWSPSGQEIIFTSGILFDLSDTTEIHGYTPNTTFISRPDGTQRKALPVFLGEGLEVIRPELAAALQRIFTAPYTFNCASGWTRLQLGKAAVVSQGASNRVRTEPKKGDNMIAQIQPGTQVKVLQGPVCADELVFWQVEGDAIPGGPGWTAEGDGKDYFLEPSP